jgi:hypothetical protein
MATGSHATRRPERPARRYASRVALTAVAVIVYLFLFFVCQRMFAGYPQYFSDILTNIGVVLIALTGGLAWLRDERRIEGED